MRELKFRIWQDNKGYLDIAHFDGGVLIATKGIFSMKVGENDSIELYTGIKDKNGKEIYEGDIVDYNDDGDCIGYVVYNAPHYEIMEKIGYPCWLKGGPHQRVIGNIHENPELLKEKE